MKQKEKKQEEKSETFIRFTGHKGGNHEDEDGRMYIRMGVYTGNLWRMAIEQTRCHENKDYASNSMLVSCMASYDIPIQLAPLFYEAEFEVEEEGLHAKFTFKDSETRQMILDCMNAQKRVSKILMQFDNDYYINRSEVELYRLKREITQTFENQAWFFRVLSQEDTVIKYQYRNEDSNSQWAEILDDPMYTIENLISVYETAGGTEELIQEEE